MTSSILTYSAHQLAQHIQNKTFSIVAVVAAYFEQIDRHNPSINAFAHLRPRAEVLAEAQAKDQLLAQGKGQGALFGVPVAIKATFQTKGLRVSNGDPLLRHHIAEQDAVLVEQFKAAGAIILGTTNVPLFSIDWQSTNFWNGQTNNPYKLERVAGGSSGGSAAAVAAQFCALTIGSDAGGSIRVPAHFCGICGLRPTEGRLSNRGHLQHPKQPHGWRHLVVTGPMARCVEDLQLLMQVLVASQEQPHAELPPVPYVRRPYEEGQPLKIAFSETINEVPVDQHYLEVFRRFMNQLKGEGHKLESVAPAYQERQAYLTCGHITGFETGSVNNPRFPLDKWLLYAFIRLKYRDHLWAKGMAQGIRLTGKQYAQAMDFKGAYSDYYHQFLSQYDVWLTPVCGVEAFKHQRAGIPFVVNGQKVPYTKAIASFTFNSALSGHPIVVIPIGHTPEGLPLGVQIHARRWDDYRLLQIARVLERLAAPHCLGAFPLFSKANKA